MDERIVPDAEPKLDGLARPRGPLAVHIAHRRTRRTSDTGWTRDSPLVIS